MHLGDRGSEENLQELNAKFLENEAYLATEAPRHCSGLIAEPMEIASGAVNYLPAGLDALSLCTILCPLRCSGDPASLVSPER